MATRLCRVAVGTATTGIIGGRLATASSFRGELGSPHGVEVEDPHADSSSSSSKTIHLDEVCSSSSSSSSSTCRAHIEEAHVSNSDHELVHDPTCGPNALPATREEIAFFEKFRGSRDPPPYTCPQTAIDQEHSEAKCNGEDDVVNSQIDYYEGDDKDFELYTEIGPGGSLLTTGGTAGDDAGATEEGGESKEDKIAKVKNFIANAKRKVHDWEILLDTASLDGVFVYFDLVHNMRDAKDVQSICIGNELWHYVKRHREKYAPNSHIIRLGAPKQVVQMVESDLFQPKMDDAYAFQRTTLEENGVLFYPVLFFMKRTLDKENKVEGQRVITLQVRGEAMGDRCNVVALNNFFRDHAWFGGICGDDPTGNSNAGRFTLITILVLLLIASGVFMFIHWHHIRERRGCFC